MANTNNLVKLAALEKMGQAAKKDIERVESKIDDITLPTKLSELTNDSGYQTAAEVNTAISSQIGRVYKAGGSKAFAELPEPSEEFFGNVYNVTDAFTTKADFVEGAGKAFPAGTDVAVVLDGDTYKLNVLSGFVDTSEFIGRNDIATNEDVDEVIASVFGTAE